MPITVRQFEATVRISESLARMQLSSVATKEPVTEALRLFHVSTLNAARSGITANLVVTPEMRAEIQITVRLTFLPFKWELQVKRQMGIGSFLSEQRLTDEIIRTGRLSESTIRRALTVMA